MTKNSRYFGYIRMDNKKTEIGKTIGFSQSAVSKFLKRFDPWENIENKP
jgi:predicted transcriptional regulator